MLKVTAAALSRLSTKLSRKKAADDAVLRFTRKPGGWKLRIDDSRPADKTFAHEGRDVLALDNEVSEAMSQMTLDVTNAKGKPRLKLLSASDSEG